MKYRKLFQFRLLHLFVLTTALSFLFAFAAADLERHRNDSLAERKLVAEIERIGGGCNSSPCGPKWCAYLPKPLRPQSSNCVTAISLPTDSTDVNYPNEAMELLLQFKHLKLVMLYGSSRCMPDPEDYYGIDTDTLEADFPELHIGVILD